jgi:hypothetical protein
MNRFLTLFCILALSVSALAQEKSKNSSALPAIKQSPEMKKLVDTFAGSWKTTTKMEKNEWFPEAGTAVGRSRIEAGPAGNSLRERNDTSGAGGGYAGFGLKWWDAQEKLYRAVWCDTMDPGGCSMAGTGRWDGDKLIFDADMEGPQGKMHMRETFSNITTNSYDFVIEAGPNAGSMKQMLSMKYERRSPRGSGAAN